MSACIFPFSAIVGRERLKTALVLTLVDPDIGGVLIKGPQGTGKSLAARAMECIAPCLPSGQFAPFYTLPLGCTEDMLLGSLDLGSLLERGEKKFLPGIFAKGDGGYLYIDEINLLKDHLVDLILDVAESHENFVEREGFSMKNSAHFCLVGSMNPEEGDLRPQFQDRFGFEVSVEPIDQPRLRAEITKRIYKFQQEPRGLHERFHEVDLETRSQIERARHNLGRVLIPPSFHGKAAELIVQLGIKSPRAEYRLLTAARAMAAFRGHFRVDEADLVHVLEISLGSKVQRASGKAMNPNFLEETFFEVWHKQQFPLQLSKEETAPTRPDAIPEVFRTNPEIGSQYSENPPGELPENLAEIENHPLPTDFDTPNPPDLHHESPTIPGYKAGGGRIEGQSPQTSDDIPFYLTEVPIAIDTSSIFSKIIKRRKISRYTGKGSRIKVLSDLGGQYVYARKAQSKSLHSIAFPASIKAHYSQMADSTNMPTKTSLAITLQLKDLHEKVNELRAPLSLYFIVDASASMRRSLPLTIKIIQSVHAEGYKKKDKVCVISFQGRSVEILQRPSVSLSVALRRLQNLEATSYTPLAAALNKALQLISQEAVKGVSIPVIIILSDLGANISLGDRHVNASTREDFDAVAQEIDRIARKIGRKGYILVLMKPLKSFATRYLGVDHISVQKIERSLVTYTSAEIFEYDTTDIDGTIRELKKIVEDAT